MLLKNLILYQQLNKEQRPKDTWQQEQAINEGGEEGEKWLGWECWDPKNTDLPAILSIEISQPFFSLKDFPKFSMMELWNSSNNTSLVNTNMMFGFLHMLC